MHVKDSILIQVLQNLRKLDQLRIIFSRLFEYSPSPWTMMSFISAIPLIETNAIDLLPPLFTHVTTKEVTIQEKKKQNNKEKTRLHEAYREERRRGQEGW